MPDKDIYLPAMPAQPPAPPAPETPWWRRGAELLGADTTIDNAITTGRALRDWIGSKLPAVSPDERARWDRRMAEQDAARVDAARQRQEHWDAFKNDMATGFERVWGTLPVQMVREAFEPTPEAKAIADLAHQHIAARADAYRAAIPEGTPDALRAVNALQTDIVPHMGVEQALDTSTPGGALSNIDLPFHQALPYLAHAAPYLAHAAEALGLGGAGHLAAGLPPGFFSRVDQVAEQVGPKGIHPNKLLSLLKSGASQEEVAYRQLDRFIADRMAQAPNAPIGKAELAEHLAAHPPPEISTTVLGESAERRAQQARLDELGRLGADRTPEQETEYDRLGRQLLHAQTYGGAPKYASYTVPGGDAYRESLTQLQRGNPEAEAALQVRLDELNRLTNKPWAERGTPEYQQLVAEHESVRRQLYDLRKQADEGAYQSTHFDQPNILVHARSTERTLPATGLRSLAEIEPLIQQAVGAKTPASIASGAPDAAVRLGLITPEEAQAYGAAKGFYGFTEPTGARGRFLEEVQSDWHQAGKRQGYQAPPTPEETQRLIALRDQIVAGQQAVSDANRALQEISKRRLDMMRAATRPHLPPEYAHVTSFDEALRGGNDTTEAWRRARETANRTPGMVTARDAEISAERRLQDAVNRVSALQNEQTALYQKTQGGIPDAPFKDTWPDLALKQQLLDVANRRDLNWLGFTSGKTQAERYDLSKQIHSLTFEPDSPGDYTGGALVAHDHAGNEVLRERGLEPHEFDQYIGKEPADKLRQQIAQHERQRAWEAEQWSVGRNEADPSDRSWYVIDPNGEIIDPSGAGGWNSRSMAEREREEIITREANEAEAPGISGLDLQVGGEGMRSFYDQLLPARLRKLLKPFGATVEAGSVPGGITREHRGTRALGHAFFDAAPPSSLISGRLPVGRNRTLYSREALGEAFLSGQLTVEDMPRSLQQAVERQGVQEPAWIARLTDEQKAKIRAQGFPLMSYLPPVILGGAAASQLAGGDDQDGSSPSPGLGAGLAALAPIALGGHAPLGDLDRTLKYLGESRYALRPSVVERLGALYEHGQGLASKASWGGAEHPELLHALGGDEGLARQWARFFGATSPGTSVPKNTQESIVAHLFAQEHPGEPFTPTSYGINKKGERYPQLSLYDNTITNAQSKIGSMNLALQGRDPSGPKTEAMAQFMYGQPRSPIDRHILWGLGSSTDILDAQHARLKAFMQAQEGMRGTGRDQLNAHKVYQRYEQALHDAIQGLDPRRPYNPLFGDTWEGARAAKGEGYQGGPIDILRARDLLGPNFLIDLDRIKAAIGDPSASWAAPPPPPRSFFGLGLAR